jgi:hypothetical protein
MDLRKNILSALLLALGYILHQIMPGAIGGMKFDVQLAMLFVIIAVNMDFKNTMVTALASGIITALTTTFPGGQLPNIIDKLITSFIVFYMFSFLSKHFSKQICIIVTGLVGTVISGTVFLTSALLIVGLPAPFLALFLTVVVPTALTNIVLTSVLYNLVNASQKAVKLGA